MRKAIRFLCLVLATVSGVALGLLCFETRNTAAHYWVPKGRDLFVDSLVTVTPCDRKAVPAASLSENEERFVSLKLFGVIPIREATVTVSPTSLVIPCGTPFGIKLYADGVMVVGFSDIDGESGRTNPAQKAGLKLGDILVSIDGKKVKTNRELAAAVENCGGKPLAVTVIRNGLTFTARFTPVKSGSQGRYQAGLWVRDSSAGIGTLTFYDPESMTFAGLGHAVCDVDTGEQIPVASGEIVPARIYGIQKGVSGTPGGLLGGFELGTLGTLRANTPYGVFGTLSSIPVSQSAIPLGLKQEVTEGEAEILTTVNGTEPAYYSVKIREISRSNAPDSHNLVLEITDKRLLEQTGGIVQGMSGSPILQNGKLIGAVTHVFVNDPTKGYGIFAENMLSAARHTAGGTEKAAS